MEQEELMKSSFDSNIGTIGPNSSASSIDESLKEIIEKLDEINNTIKGVYNIEEKNVQVDEPVVESSNEVEIPTEETEIEEPIIEVTSEPVEDNSNVPLEEPIITEEPIIENINIAPETPVEDTFSPVEEPVSIEETKVEENNNVISMDELLSSMNEATDKPVEEQTAAVAPLAYEEPKEVIAPAVKEEVNPAVEVTPIVEEPKVETPVIEETKPVVETVTPVVTEEVKPIVEVTPIVETPKVETPVIEETKPVVETVTPVAEATPIVENPKVDAPIDNKYGIVTPLYVGMSEVKTGNDPHRVIAIKDNNVFNKNQSEEKTLIMNKIA